MNLKDTLILYVDDERSNRVIFEEVFGSTYRIETVGSPVAALDIIRSGKVGVIITDQRMPEMTGNELLAEVKKINAEIVRIVITAYSDMDPILRAVNEGLVARYIVKPWNKPELFEILRWAVEVAQLSRTNSALHLRVMQTERLVTLGTMGAAIIHDLNQPITYVASNASRMQFFVEAMPALEKLINKHRKELSDEDFRNLNDMTVELKEILDDMTAGCEVMRSLTSSVRRFLKQTGEEKLEPVAPMPVVRYALAACRPVALETGAQLQYEGPEDLPKVKIGNTEFTQVMVNLISNAAQSIRQYGKRVIVTAKDDGNVVRFTVADQGCGMSKELLEKVGTPFYSTRKQGTGLGFAQVRRHVEGAGGIVKVESKVDLGTTIEFTLPKA